MSNDVNIDIWQQNEMYEKCIKNIKSYILTLQKVHNKIEYNDHEKSVIYLYILTKIEEELNSTFELSQL